MKRRFTDYIFQGVTTIFCMLVMVGCTDDDAFVENNRNKVNVVPSFSTQAQPEILTRADEGPKATGERFGSYIEAETYPVGTSMGVVFRDNNASPSAQTSYTIPLVPTTTSDKFTGKFTYKGQNNKPYPWTSSVNVDPDCIYTVMGQVPHDCAETATYNFAQDKDGYYTITLDNVTPVNDADVSVIVGVGKNHYWDNKTNETPNTEKDKNGNDVIIGAIPGQFQYTTVKEKTNVICLLMDHLFAQTKFSFAIDPDYHKLRDIRIRKLSLSMPDIAELDAVVKLDPNVKPTDAAAAETNTPTLSAIVSGYPVWTMKKYSQYTGTNEELSKLRALITANNWPTGGNDVSTMELKDLIKVAQDNSSTAVIYDQSKGIDIPTGYDVKDKDDPDKKDDYEDALEDEQQYGYLLTETCPAKGIRGFFTPVASVDQPVTFRLTIVYDVFDMKGNKTRSLATATNSYTTKMEAADSTPENPKYVSIERGNSYRIEITVKPSYLYQLSDGDLDNPVFVQSN